MSSVLPYSSVISRTIPAQAQGKNLRTLRFGQKFESEPFGIGEKERQAKEQAAAKKHRRHHLGMLVAAFGMLGTGLLSLLGGHNMASMNHTNQPPAIHSQHSGMQPGTKEWDEMCKMPGMESMCGNTSTRQSDNPFRFAYEWVSDPSHLMMISGGAMVAMHAGIILAALGIFAGSIKRRLAADPRFKLDQQVVLTLMNETNAELAHQKQPYRLVKVNGARQEVRVREPQPQEWLTQVNKDILTPILGVEAELTPDNLVRLTAEDGGFYSKKEFNKAAKRAQELLLSLNLQLVPIE